MSKDHKAGSKIDASIDIGRHHDFLIEEFHASSSSPDLGYVDSSKPPIECVEVNTFDNPGRYLLHASCIELAIGEDTAYGMVSIVDPHFEDTRQLLETVSTVNMHNRRGD